MCYDIVMNKLLDQQTVKEVFWDRPEMTPETLMMILKNPQSSEYYPVLGRMVERMATGKILTLVDKNTLYAAFPKLRIWNKMMIQKAEGLFSGLYRKSQ